MDVNVYIASLVQYGLNKKLVQPCDTIYVTNGLLEAMKLDSYDPAKPEAMSLEDILQGLLEDAVERGICDDDITSRDLFDTKLMGILTPMPREVHQTFSEMYATSPETATDWYYNFSQDTDYIRRYRIQKDVRWKTATEYGNLDVTINLSKPEKDPKAIAAAKLAPQSGYPKCMLCAENEGYAGRMNHPARQNLRTIPVTIAGEGWHLQYSPYVYYNEHCIVFNHEHVPMVINKAAFSKLLDFVSLFPHYFVGSNADLPIVGGSILSHEHFQGGHYCFPMERAAVEREIVFAGFEDVKAGIVKWPMSVIRLRCGKKARLVELADKILLSWRGYTDEDAFIFAETEGVPHNTITPIARMHDQQFELDLVLRNNITTDKSPWGVYHPSADLHHIKKENIGLIEVMGLAVLPARLKQEMEVLEDAILNGRDIRADERICKHADWAEGWIGNHELNRDNIHGIIQDEISRVFVKVLECSGVYKRTEDGMKAFSRFISSL